MTRPGEASTRSSSQSCPSTTIPPEDVELQLYIESYAPLDTLHSTWGFVAYVRTWWTDPRLVYNGTADGGCTDELVLSPSDLDQVVARPKTYLPTHPPPLSDV